MKKRILRRQMVGTVVSDKMDKTVIVLVEMKTMAQGLEIKF